jgi:hypothetical protein
MVDVKLTKLFIDPNTGLDVYILSFRLGNSYHSIPCTKEQFEGIFYGVRSIFNNSLEN